MRSRGKLKLNRKATELETAPDWPVVAIDERTNLKQQHVASGIAEKHCICNTWPDDTGGVRASDGGYQCEGRGKYMWMGMTSVDGKHRWMRRA